MRHNYTYQAFGDIDRRSENTQNSYLFVGEQWDLNISRYYLRQRYYDIETGRFTRKDAHEGTHDEPLTLHKYLYSRSNPVNFSDPTGLFFIGELAAANSIRSIISGINIDASSRFIATTTGGSSFEDDFVKDLAVSLAIPLGIPILGAVIKAFRKPAQGILDQGGWLWRHEAGLGGGSALGHTIDRHVNKSVADLNSRISTSGISRASSFPDASIAEKVIKEAMLQNRADIRTWLMTPGSNVKKAFSYTGNGTVVGYGVTATNSSPVNLSNAKIVLKKRDPGDPKKGFFVLTAHPE
jgi:RHS repeat-associated protein